MVRRKTMTTELKKPCVQCPWRLSNQGKRHFGGFYTKVNLRRLWNQVRGGGRAQSCHLTDPSHPDHIKAGAKVNGGAVECPGSVILIRRELRQMADADGVIGKEGLQRYQKTRKKGLTKHGILYWIVQRVQLAGVPMAGGLPLPEVDDSDKEIGLPSFLE
jgi:hypothetical protein